MCGRLARAAGARWVGAGGGVGGVGLGEGVGVYGEVRRGAGPGGAAQPSGRWGGSARLRWAWAVARIWAR